MAPSPVPRVSKLLVNMKLTTPATYTDAELAPLLQPFKKEAGMSWANPEGCLWIFAFDEGVVVGVCALALMGSSGRCKSDVVLAVARGRGVYKALSAARIEYARGLGLTKLTAYAGAASKPQFLKDGFIEQSVNAHGIAYMVKDLCLTNTPKRW